MTVRARDLRKTFHSITKQSARAFPAIFANAEDTELARMEGFKGKAEIERIMERVR